MAHCPNTSASAAPAPACAVSAIRCGRDMQAHRGGGDDQPMVLMTDHVSGV